MIKKWMNILLAAVLLAHGSFAMAGTPSVAVYNDTRVRDLGGFLAGALPEQLQEQLKARNLAIYAQSASFEDLRLCHAKVGITEAAPRGRNARHPSYWVFAAHAMDEASWERGTCEGTALGHATAALMREKVETLFSSSEVVRNAGGTRTADKADNTRVRIHQTGGIGDHLNPLFAMLHVRSMGEVFDYRAVQTVIETNTAELADGRFICLARVGLSARSNEGRNPRMPAYVNSFVKIVDGGDATECKLDAAKKALQGFLELPYEQMLTDFSLTREDGRPQPSLQQVRASAKRLAAKASNARAGQSRQVEQTSVSCTNQCRNGDCLRTFADGRKERWTAPHVFDPFTRQWKWDTTTNACGV